MDLERMRDAVRSRLGVAVNDAFYTAQQLTDFVNEAIQAISIEEDWPWLQASTTFSTQDGVQTYTPLDDWARTKSLCIEGYNPMQWRTLAEIRQFGTTDEDDAPRYFTVYGDQILLSPVPNTAKTVIHDYVIQEDLLVEDTDTPILPSQFRFAAVAYASYLALSRSPGNMPRAQLAMADYQAWKDRMLKNRRRQTAPTRVRVRPGSAL